MTKIIVLGGSGVVGKVTVKTLTEFPDFSEITIGDINTTKAQESIDEIGSEKVFFRKINVLDSEMLRNEIKKFDIIINCIGPFYKYGALVLKAAIDTKKKYIDINDDVDATREVLAMNDEAKKAKISALIGMGSSPGITNILARFAADQLLDEVDSIDLYHAHGGEPTEGPGVIYHRIHSMSIDIPLFVGGKFKTVKFFEESGKSLEEEVEFWKLGTYRVHPYPHPETITLPKYIQGIKRVTNKGTVLPSEYFYLIADLVKLGLNSHELLDVKGTKIKPVDLAISHILKQRDVILKKIDFGPQRGCVKIVVKGFKDGRSHQIIFSLASVEQAMGEGTGIPAAIGAILMKRGLIQGEGVLPPEACVDPGDFLSVMQEYFSLKGISSESSPLLIESIDHEGNVEQLSL